MEIGVGRGIEKKATAASLFETEIDCFPCKENPWEPTKRTSFDMERNGQKEFAADLWKMLKIVVAACGEGLKRGLGEG